MIFNKPIIICFSLLAFSCFDHRAKNSSCRETKKMLEQSIEGKILEVYKSDFNLAETIMYLNEGDTIKSLMFVNERSGVFETLRSGDDIFKVKGSLNFSWTRYGKTEYIRLDYGCNDNVKKRVVN
ncbi:hypothetical protein [Reichenbachiella sp. MSK19-1]|uniref:hypothetical protein n=1 Tax=Reichenbachiella sp. MSK19-1 TaxID=1897631 RepID=UPI000E6CC9D7|nr:hypothetical protein [Reichenbachiella sp. MSK19-1]RJE74979.1 hypothetical protein BGP76_17830 [Reichenbachiella sp. MSK19-1]